jgi:hypothetical protein
MDDYMIFSIASLLGTQLGTMRREARVETPTPAEMKRYFALTVPFVAVYFLVGWARGHAPDAVLVLTLFQAVCAFAVGALVFRAAADWARVRRLVTGLLGLALLIAALVMDAGTAVVAGVIGLIGAAMLWRGVVAWRSL